MKRVIIVEGADNIGKTTLCRRLAKETHGTIIHQGAPKAKGAAALKESLTVLRKTLARLEEKAGPQVEIWDRSVIGERVYGPMYRASQYNHAIYRDALEELVLYQAQVLCVICYADETTLEKFEIWPKHNEHKLYEKASEVEKISIAFVNAATQLGLKHTLLVNSNNYETLDARNDLISKRVERFLKGKRFVFTRTNDYGLSFFNHGQRIWDRKLGFMANPYHCNEFKADRCAIGLDHRALKMFVGGSAIPIGAVGVRRKANFIFVGESTGYNTDGLQLGMPFYNGESGCLFQTALTALHVLPTKYYMTNVIKCNPKDNQLGKYVNRETRHKLECVGELDDELADAMEESPCAKVIAIGKIAAEELARMKIEHTMTYHPSYYLRLGRPDDFILNLREAMAS